MPLAELYEEFVGVTAIAQSFTGRLSNTPSTAPGPIMPRVVPGSRCASSSRVMRGFVSRC